MRDLLMLAVAASGIATASTAFAQVELAPQTVGAAQCAVEKLGAKDQAAGYRCQR